MGLIRTIVLDILVYVANAFSHSNYLKILSPHWDPKDPSGVQSRIYEIQSVRLFVCISVRPGRFLSIKACKVLRAAHVDAGNVVTYLECQYNMSIRLSIWLSMGFLRLFYLY